MFNRKTLLKYIESMNEGEYNNTNVKDIAEEDEELTPKEIFNNLIDTVVKKKDKKTIKKVTEELIILIKNMYPPKMVTEEEIFD